MRVLVTGATANVGRMVVDELLGSGVDVRALTSDPARAALPPDVEVHEGFIGRPHTVRDALVDVDAMYLAPYPRTARQITEMARGAGVRRIVALSQFNVDEEIADGPASWWWYATEHAVENAVAEWTMLRPGEFMASTLEWADSIRDEG
ncbi:MAG TPA: NAD(P)H-binding protein, partial [Actinopolymorphaceae bacterium]|nr:NAD(P)H-binding protein [Actinopolymorphaceae bacterium]